MSRVLLALVWLCGCSVISKPSEGGDEIRCITLSAAEDPCADLIPKRTCSLTNGETGECLPVLDQCGGNGIDDDLDGLIDEDTIEETCNTLDDDCDGTVDENVAPTDAIELCNGKDDDCDGTVDEAATPSPEVCDGADNDCDMIMDEGTMMLPEVCNGRDDNCNGIIDEGYDLDGDGFFVCGTDCRGVTPGEECPVTNAERDCDDANTMIHPRAMEVCDAVDHDCDGQVIPLDIPAANALCGTAEPFCEPVRGCVPDDCQAMQTTSPCLAEEVCDSNVSPPMCVRTRCSDEQCQRDAGQNFFCNVTTGDCQERSEVGETCISDRQCTTGVCLARSTLNLDLPSEKICMLPCCTDAGCAPGQFCWDAGNGATSCLPAAGFETSTGRSSLGSAGPGASCTENTECQSGLCNSGTCLLTCRHDDDCAGWPSLCTGDARAR